MTGSGGGGFVIDLTTIAAIAGIVVLIGALAWIFFRR
jgi:LPXTG-motif cell wall-anchored protein